MNNQRFPFENINLPNHEANGYKVDCTHSGQKRAYGDTFREFIILSDKPEAEVEQYCKDSVYECSLTYDDWLAVERSPESTMDTHFRTSYKFKKTGDGEYFYQVIQQSTH